jgi:Tfp pilus assembly protein FimT
LIHHHPVKQLSRIITERPSMERGYSLMETILCTGIISLSFTIALPSLWRWHANRQLFTTAEELRLALERCYVSAVTHQEPIKITVQEDGIVTGASTTRTLFTLTPPPSIAIKPRSSQQAELFFYPNHSATPGTVLASSPHGECSVIVSLRGRVRRVCV